MLECAVVFKVIVGDHEYVMYSDGHVEGFGENAIVCNYHPQLMAIEHAQARPETGAAGTT